MTADATNNIMDETPVHLSSKGYANGPRGHFPAPYAPKELSDTSRIPYPYDQIHAAKASGVPSRFATQISKQGVRKPIGGSGSDKLPVKGHVQQPLSFGDPLKQQLAKVPATFNLRRHGLYTTPRNFSQTSKGPTIERTQLLSVTDIIDTAQRFRDSKKRGRGSIGDLEVVIISSDEDEPKFPIHGPIQAPCSTDDTNSDTGESGEESKLGGQRGGKPLINRGDIDRATRIAKLSRRTDISDEEMILSTRMPKVGSLATNARAKKSSLPKTEDGASAVETDLPKLKRVKLYNDVSEESDRSDEESSHDDHVDDRDIENADDYHALSTLRTPTSLSRNSSSAVSKKSRPVPSMDVTGGMSKKCMLSLFVKDKAIWAAQMVVWNYSWIMGHQILPFASFSAESIPQDDLRRMFLNEGCFSAFTESEKNSLGRSQPRSAKATPRDALFRNTSDKLHIVGIGETCGSCNKHHEDSGLTWIAIMLLGVGCLTPEDLKRYSKRVMHFSHLCGNDWCINPFHIYIEPGDTNYDRASCHRNYRKGKGYNCAHQPPCMLVPKQDPIVVRQTYGARMKLLLNKRMRCPDSDCDCAGKAPDIMYHVMKDHALVEEPVMLAEEIGLKCDGCEVLLATRRTIANHQLAVAAAKDCPTPGFTKKHFEAEAEKGYGLLKPLQKAVTILEEL